MERHFNLISALEYDRNESREKYCERMIAEGFRIVVPAPNELQIDIDTQEQYDLFLNQLSVLEQNMEVGDIEEHYSKSGPPRRHITIILPFDVSPELRIAFQAALGSDPTRELLSAIRITMGDKVPTLFSEEGEDNSSPAIPDFVR